MTQHNLMPNQRAKITVCPPYRWVTSRYQPMSVLMVVITILILLFLGACASQQHPDPAKQKDAWLAKNYSPSANAKRSTLVQLPSNTRFRQQILRGQIANGMTLDDAIATLRMQPYGQQPQQAAFWCDDQRVSACSNRCLNCEATLFGQHNIVLLQGTGRRAIVKDLYPKRFEDYRASVGAGAIRFADQIHQRQIVPGMSAGVVQMIINQQHYHTQYFCGTSAKADSRSCLGTCNLCKVIISGRSDAQGSQSIFLETHGGQQTVSNVLTQ